MVLFVCNPNLEEVLDFVTIYDFTVSFVQTRYSSRDNGSNDKVLDYSFLPLLDEADKFCLRQVCVQINQFFFHFPELSILLPSKGDCLCLIVGIPLVSGLTSAQGANWITLSAPSSARARS